MPPVGQPGDNGVQQSRRRRPGQVRQAAERRRHRERAERACAVLGLPIDTAPEDALQNELAWCNGHVQWLRGQVAELTVADLTCNTGAALVGLYGAERDRLVTIARVMIAADVHGRMQETARQLAAWLTAVLDGALDSSRLAFDQAEAVAAELPGKIRTIPFPHLGVIDGSDGLDGDGDGAA